ncbi:MAG: RrF2 family transcriptional regulator [bacterium]
MKMSTKGRYAVTAMFDLASEGVGVPISAAVISKRQKISLSYLEQLLNKLKRAGLIKTLKGPSGGYSLAKEPTKISVGDIVRATEGPVALADCTSKGTCCPKSGCCSTKSLWTSLSKKVSALLDETSLADLCQKGKR